MEMRVNLSYEDLRKIITDTYGVEFNVPYDIDNADNRLDIRPASVEVGEGFIIRIRFRHNITIFEFIVESFGREVFRVINNRMNSIEKSQFQEYCKCINSIGEFRSAKLLLRINGIEYAPESVLPDNWERLELSLKVYNIEWTDDSEINNKLIEPWVVVYTGTILSLLPLKNRPVGEFTYSTDDYEQEGAIIREEISKYERSPLNRNICLSLKGYTCEICGFNFQEMYGDIGKDFAIVHHVEPLSEMDAPRVLNPENDLAVVCGNCHLMLHSRRPALTIDELKNKIFKGK